MKKRKETVHNVEENRFLPIRIYILRINIDELKNIASGNANDITLVIISCYTVHSNVIVVITSFSADF
jgi:hypothetical protein